MFSRVSTVVETVRRRALRADARETERESFATSRAVTAPPKRERESTDRANVANRANRSIIRSERSRERNSAARVSRRGSRVTRIFSRSIRESLRPHSSTHDSTLLVSLSPVGLFCHELVRETRDRQRWRSNCDRTLVAMVVNEHGKCNVDVDVNGRRMTKDENVAPTLFGVNTYIYIFLFRFSLSLSWVT